MKKTTVQEIINRVYDQFNQASIYFGHGTTNAWDEVLL